MGTTKYIVDNVANQTIDGNLNIQGTLKSNDTAVYKALLTQTGANSGNNLSSFNYGLIIGETYTITNYASGDDFSNIALTQSGDINTTGFVFTATGDSPSIWDFGSVITSNGGLIVDVLENSLGYDLNWAQAPFGGYGYYAALNDTTGPIYNSFPRNKVEIITPFKYAYDGGLFPPFIVPYIDSYSYNKDSMIIIDVIDVNGGPGGLSNNLLYYTPIEIRIKQDTDTTPILVYGENVSSLPYGNVSVEIYAATNLVETFYNASYTSVANMTELVAKLNEDPGTNLLGEYAVNPDVEEGVILTMATNLKNQFSPNNILTFKVFND